MSLKWFFFKNIGSYRFLKIYLISFLAISIYSIFFGYSFDESVFSGYAANFYYYGSNPFYFWGMGAYYLGVDIASYFPTILLNILGLHNVVVEELGVKIAIDISFFIGGLVIYKIIKEFGKSEKLSESAAYVFLFSPLLFFYAPFQGNPLDFTLTILLGSFYYILKHKYKISLSLLGIATASYLYPLFLFPAFILYVIRKSKTKKAIVPSLLFIIITAVGFGAQFISYYLNGYSINNGTIFSNNGGVGSITTSLFIPPIWNIYYFINIVNVQLPYVLFQLFFIIVMLVPDFAIILRSSKNEITPLDLLYVMSFQGLSFAFFSPISDPQYLLAALPFILLLCFINERTEPILLLYVSTIIAIVMVAFVTPYNFNQYFVDINRSAGAIELFAPSYVLPALSICYSAVGILVYLILFTPKESKRKQHCKFIKTSEKVMKYSILGIIIFSASTVAIVIPGFSHTPDQFAYQQNDASQGLVIQELNSSGHVAAYGFSLPSNWNFISNNVKNNSAVGIYLSIPLNPTQFGVIGSNETFPFNSSHYILESFYVETESDASQLTFGYINDSYLHSVISLLYDNSSGHNSTVLTLNASKGIVKYFDTFPNDYNQYIVSFPINKILKPGYYSVIIEGTSKNTYYLGGLKGDPQTHGITNISTIGAVQNVVNDQPLKYDRISFYIQLYYIGDVQASLNGHRITVREAGSISQIVKVPTSYLKPQNIFLILYPSNFTINTAPTVYYYTPFPDSGIISQLDINDFIIGMTLFIALSSAFVILSRKILLSFRDTRNK